MTIADAAMSALREAGGELHGRQILQRVQLRGFLNEAKNPMPALDTAMRRDSRIQKVEKRPNTWRLLEK